MERRGENEGSRPQTPSESAKLWRLTDGKRGWEGFIDRRRLTTPARAYIQGVPGIGLTIKSSRPLIQTCNWQQ